MSDSPTVPVMEAANLAKSYRSGSRVIEVLQDVSLSLSKGQTMSIRGESGSGKSTLLNLLAGIESADEGGIRWNGQSLDSIADARRPAIRAGYLGFVFQSFYLIPELNALENVILAGRIAGKTTAQSRQMAEALMQELGLADRLFSRPEQLSGGERQRTAIARALINQPQVLLADEPTGNLDEKTSERVMEQLLAMVDKHNTALVLVTHNIEFANRTGIKLQLEHGRLV